MIFRITIPALVLLMFVVQEGAAAIVADIPDNYKDSLEKALAMMNARDKIAAYDELAGMSAPEEAEKYINLMAEVAEESGDRDAQIDAMYKRAMIYYVAGSLKEFMDAMDKVKPFLLQARDDRYVFAEIFVIKRLLAEGRNETASRIARDFLELAGNTDSRYWEGYAYYGIGLTYKAGGYLDKSAEAMKKGFEILSTDNHIRYSELIRIAFDFIDLLIEKGDYGIAAGYGRIAEALLKDRNEDGETQLMKMYLYSDLAICYVSLDDMNEAERCLSQAACHLDPSGGLDNQQYNKASAMYYQSLKDYDKALRYAGECVQAYSATGNWLSYYIDALALESGIMADSGNHSGAYSLLLKVQHLKDSLASEQLALQLSEFYTLYEVDRLEAKRQKQQITIIMTCSLCLLLIIIVSIFIVYSHRLNKKNISLYNSIQENRKKEEEQSRIRQFVPLESISGEQKLYYRLCRLMEEEKLFTDPNLKRAGLAQKLGTNEKYLADAVKNGAGTTVTGFVTEYRLNHSMAMLAENPELSLETVSEMSGFGAYSSFFRAFSRKFGMTPLEYRKYLKRRS